MNRSPVFKEVISWLVHIVLAVILTLIIVNYVGRFTIVIGDSMLPTLKSNSVLLIEKITQRFGEMNAGDIVVIRIPEYLGEERTYAIKRMIAVEGQHLTVRDGNVYVDGEKLDEDYIFGSTTSASDGLYDDMVIPEGCIYVLGDNRLPRKSRDSRTFGPVNVDRIEGRVIFRLFPFSELGVVN